MKSPRSLYLIFSAALGITLTPHLHAQGPGHGPGGFQEAIHKLFNNHEKINRTVEITGSGYKSRTVSDDPEIAKTLQKHVREMRERLGAGMMIRRWDPAFAELVEHYEEIDHEFKEVEGGVEMTAKGKTPDAVKVVQNHARIVSGFVEKGPEQMHEPHARALGHAEKPDAAKAAGTECPESPGAEAACPKCGKKAAPATGCPKCARRAKPESTCPKCEEKTKPEAKAAGKAASQTN